jgi:starch-binding outer membrane protein, SusD/RagB family
MKMKILYLIVMVAVLTSCTEKFLDEKDPNRQTTDNFWKTEADLKTATATLYWNATWWNAMPFSLINILRHEYWCSDNADPSSFNYSNDPSTSPDFRSNYRGIFNCNQIIQYGGAMDIDESIKKLFLPG